MVDAELAKRLAAEIKRADDNYGRYVQLLRALQYIAETSRDPFSVQTAQAAITGST